MNLPSNALEFCNYVQKYEIVPKETYDFMSDYICAKPYSHGKEKVIKGESIKKPIYLDVVNLPLTNHKKIIAFCDNYGLFQPSGKDMSSAMAMDSFYQCTTIIKSMFYVHENLHDKTNGSTPDVLLQYLLTLLSSRYYLHIILALPKYSSLSKYIFPCTENTGGSFQLLYQYNILNTLNTPFVSSLQIRELSFCRPYNDITPELNTDLHKLVDELEKEKIPFYIDNYGMFSIPQNTKLTSAIKDILYNIAPKILAWRIQEILKNVCHEFYVNDQGKFTIHWRINSLFEYMVLAMAFDFSNTYYYAKCQNINCGELYIPERAATAKYCSTECKNAVAQRKSSKKKKEIQNSQQTKNISVPNET